MPCRYDYEPAGQSYKTEYEEQKSENDKLLKDNNQLTRMLCSLCSRIEEQGEDLISGIDELEDWWTEHKRLDAIRIQKEKLEQKRKDDIAKMKRKLEKKRQSALSKLTDDEIAALGLTRKA